MGRYANATIPFEFPDLSLDDDKIYVIMRNPKTMPIDKLVPGDVPTNEDGTRDSAVLTTATYEIIAGLITDWHVYDATTDEDLPPLGLPATADTVRTLPLEILNKLMESISEAVATPR